jgi:hypothetical protein
MLADTKIVNEQILQTVPLSESVPARKLGVLDAEFDDIVAVLGEPTWRGDDDFPGDPDHQRLSWRCRETKSGAMFCIWDWDSPCASVAANKKWNLFWVDGSAAVSSFGAAASSPSAEQANESGASGSGERLCRDVVQAIGDLANARKDEIVAFELARNERLNRTVDESAIQEVVIDAGVLDAQADDVLDAQTVREQSKELDAALATESENTLSVSSAGKKQVKEDSPVVADQVKFASKQLASKKADQQSKQKASRKAARKAKLEESRKSEQVQAEAGSVATSMNLDLSTGSEPSSVSNLDALASQTLGSQSKASRATENQYAASSTSDRPEAPVSTRRTVGRAGGGMSGSPSQTRGNAMSDSLGMGDLLGDVQDGVDEVQNITQEYAVRMREEMEEVRQRLERSGRGKVQQLKDDMLQLCAEKVVNELSTRHRLSRDKVVDVINRAYGQE